MKVITTVLLTLGLCTSALADVTQFEGYNVHHNAFNSDFLLPEVARSYDIKRSNKMALLNITVTVPQENAPEKPVAAVVTGTARNLIQQTRHLQFQEIRETDAIYYIAEFPITNELVLHFEINASHDGKAIGTTKFTQMFYR